MTNRTAIEIDQLSKQFAYQRGWRLWRSGKPLVAVKNVSFQVREGELFGLLGPNGAGKTTLVKMLCTLVSPTSGTMRVAGFAAESEQAIRREVGLVVNRPRSFYWRLSARQNLRFFASLHNLSGSAAAQRVSEVLDDVGLLDKADVPFSSLSSGMMQRVAIARGLLHRPKILFLDEPSRSLDPVNTDRLHDLILRLMANHGMTTFLITHDLYEAEKLCQRIAVMDKGEIRALGRPAELRSQLQPYHHYRVQCVGVSAELLAKLKQLVTQADLEAPTLLTFRASESGAEVNAVLDLLRAHNVTIERITSSQATLQELFNQITQVDPVKTG